MMKLLGAAKFPLILGNDFAGVVEDVGASVTGWRRCEWVFGCKAASRMGSHAEFVTVPAEQVLRLPEPLTPEEAAAVPYSFVTAYRLIDAGLGWLGADCRKRRVLIHGGMGSVGSLAVRLLSNMGAVVDISDCAPSIEDVVSRGGTEAVDLSTYQQKTLAGKYDAVLNCARFQDEETLFPLLKRGGRYATIVHPLIATIDESGWVLGGLRARAVWRQQADRVRAYGGEGYRWVLFKPDSRAFQALERLAVQGQINPEIASVLNASDAASAHALMSAGKQRGKAVLKMP